MPARILVAGASSVLGFATAEMLQAEGHELWLTQCRPEKLAPLKARFPGAQIRQMDIRATAQVQVLGSEIAETWKRLDGLICAFGTGNLVPVHRTTTESVSDQLRVNVAGPVELARQCFPLLLKGHYPGVVFFSSTMEMAGAGGMSLYAAAKGAVASFTRALAIEWAPRRIRVNAVAPGIVPSPLVDQMFAPLTPEQVTAVRERHPLGLGEPADVASAVCFLLSPAAKWITGIVLPVDGGYTAQ
jgi:NAD(P)-dependent dehydrogenase (short-subunit alcohol dehydrogenase family)